MGKPVQEGTNLKTLFVNVGSEFPKIFIYFLLQGDKVVYVGQTRKGLSRPLSHSGKRYDAIEILPCKENELDFLESRFILKYSPLYNQTAGNSKYYKSLKQCRNILRETFYPFSLWDLKHALHNMGIEPVQFNGNAYITEEELVRCKRYILNHCVEMRCVI